MLEFFSSILSLFLKTGEVKSLQAVNWNNWLDAAWVTSLGQPTLALEPTAMAIVQQHVDGVGAVGMSTASQGVWVQTEDQILAEHQGQELLSAASLTKIPTTLVALATWKPDHQFTTLISATGPIQDGVLQGDLVIQAGGDPFFVWEEAIALGNALEQVGIQQIDGDLLVTENFVMNFQSDPTVSGNLLKRGINADLWNAEAATQYQTLPTNTPQPRITVNGVVRVLSLAEAANLSAQPIVRHQSLPMVDILRAMNIYSNNLMADMMANSVGGAAVVANKAAQLAGFPPEEIHLINGSGLGDENRISPRAVGAMLIAIQHYVQPYQLTVADLFPVIGRDRGTLGGRNLPVGAAVKTGTLNNVSALAGVISTRDRGLVWFSIINVGTADLDFLHDQQDLLVQQLVQDWGADDAATIGLTMSDRTQIEGTQLGAFSRNEILP